MNKNKSLLLVAVAALGLFASSCKKERTTPSGFKYTHVDDNGGRKGQDEDIVKFHFTMYTEGDSVIDQSDRTDSVRVPMYQLTKEPMIKLLDEAFRAGAVGDSMLFVVKAEDVFGEQIPPMVPVKKGETMKVGIKIVDIKSIAEMEEDRNKKSAEQGKKDQTTIAEHVAKKGLKTQKTASGMQYVVTTPGTGAKAKAGDTAKVHYTGRLLNGEKFDSSVDRNQPFEFPVGMGQVIPGWDEALQLLPVGSKATIFLPSNLAYGERGAGPIPPNSILEFDIEVLGVTPAAAPAAAPAAKK